jgi:hypothetical protein
VYFPASPPFIQFLGVVEVCIGRQPWDWVGRDHTQLFCDIFYLENGEKPEPGWDANYVYAMLPKTKGHLTKSSRVIRPTSTPFWRKAYVDLQRGRRLPRGRLDRRGHAHPQIYKMSSTLWLRTAVAPGAQSCPLGWACGLY